MKMYWGKQRLCCLDYPIIYWTHPFSWQESKLIKIDHAEGARALEGDDQSRTSLNTSGSPSSCSRMRRMLFRRARSETEDRMRNNTRFNKVDSITDSPTPGSVHSRLNVVPQTSVLEGATATAPTSALSRLQSLMPRSPPPPYDTNSEVSKRSRGNHFSILKCRRRCQHRVHLIAEWICSFG